MDKLSGVCVPLYIIYVYTC